MGGCYKKNKLSFLNTTTSSIQPSPQGQPVLRGSFQTGWWSPTHTTWNIKNYEFLLEHLPPPGEPYLFHLQESQNGSKHPTRRWHMRHVKTLMGSVVHPGTLTLIAIGPRTAEEGRDWAYAPFRLEITPATSSEPYLLNHISPLMARGSVGSTVLTTGALAPGNGIYRPLRKTPYWVLLQDFGESQRTALVAQQYPTFAACEEAKHMFLNRLVDPLAVGSAHSALKKETLALTKALPGILKECQESEQVENTHQQTLYYSAECEMIVYGEGRPLP